MGMRNCIAALATVAWTTAVLPVPVRSTIGGKSISFSNAEEIPSYTAADYVQDGLVGLWDGIENVGIGTHDSSSETWVDLTGYGRNFAVYSYFTDKGLVCDGASNAAYCGTQIPALCSAVKHYEVVSKFNFETVPTSSGTANCMLIHLRSSGTGQIVFGTGYMSGGRCRVSLNRLLNIVPDNAIHSYSCCSYPNRNTTYLTAVDGVEYTPIANYGGGEFANYFYLGSSKNGGTPCPGVIYCLRIYDRELTAEERAHNLKVDRARYVR